MGKFKKGDDKVFNWHKCENGLPIPGDEPEENIELLIVCKESISNKIFYKTNAYNKKRLGSQISYAL